MKSKQCLKERRQREKADAGIEVPVPAFCIGRLLIAFPSSSAISRPQFGGRLLSSARPFPRSSVTSLEGGLT